MATRRRWVLIAFGVAILLVFVAIGAIIGVTAWFQENLHVENRSESEAQSEFDIIRKKFSGRAPLLQLRDGRPEYHPDLAAPPQAPGSVETLHVLAWDPDDGRLARLAVPFWLVRMKSEPIRLGSYASGMDDHGIDLRPSDIEKYGPGIIIDTASPSGERVLLWAE
jgi:hypothetical protein